MIARLNRSHPESSEAWERLATLALRNNIPMRTMYAFVHDGMRVSRPMGGRTIYSRQAWLDEYLESKLVKAVTP